MGKISRKERKEEEQRIIAEMEAALKEEREKKEGADATKTRNQRLALIQPKMAKMGGRYALRCKKMKI